LLAFKRVVIPLIALAFIVMWGGPAQSGTAGKIAGIVTDAVTGEPLQGATVRVQGTQFATETDIDGEFYFINIPVGVHELAVTIMGYESYTMTDIRVLMDLTTPLDIGMRKSPVNLDKSVTVVAQRPRIQKDKTSSGAIVTRDEISYLANSRNVQSVISNMAGTVVDGQGTLHVRGGRQGTVTYFFDGFSIQDPFTGEMGIRIVPDALEELSLTSGGLAPEYGEALSGVVNAITREGNDQFSGRIKMSDGATHQYDVSTGNFGGLKRNGNRSLMIDLSGPIARINDQEATFFTAFEYLTNDGYLPHNKSELFSGVGKIVMFPTDRTKLVVNGSYYTRDLDYYDHRDVNGISYDFNLDGLPKVKNEAYLFGLKTSYSKSANTVLSFQVNRFYSQMKLAPEHLFDLYWNQWPGYSDSAGIYNGTIQDSNYQASEEYLYYGYTTGDDFYPRYLERKAAYTGSRFSFLSQLDKNNQIKFGGDIRRYDLDWDSRQFFNAQPYGETYSASPYFGAAYVQDKIELNDMIVNIGLRFDYLYTDIEYWHDPIEKDYRKSSSPKVQWSPRLGISHPVSERSVLHFNYGYLFQPPDVSLMYTNLQGDLESGYPLFGNPDLDAEKTVYYELGWTQLLNDDLRIHVTTYYRDIKNMVGAREVVDDRGNIFTVFANSDYGSVKGFDFALESLRRNLLNWSINYSYMIASGNASDPYEWYYDYFTVEGDERPVQPTTEYPLSYDQRHNLTTVLDFRVGRNDNITFLGARVPNSWGINLLARYGSGMAYTKTDKNGKRLGSLNGERMPYTLRFDMRFNKDFHFSEKSRNYFSFFVEVENLFDRRNVVDVYTSTGSADNDGRLALNVNSPTYEQERLWSELLAKDPLHFDHPRQLRLGLEFNF